MSYQVRVPLRAAVLDTLRHRLAVCRKLNTMPYAEREAVFRRIDELQAAAEEFVCAAPDYPNED